jgi:hypothetical protein
MNKTLASIGLLCMTLAAVVGCEVRPSVVPVSDPVLKRSSAQFAADAAKRHPFKADLPKGEGEVARAIPDYSLDRIDIANLSGRDLGETEIWINRTYVMSLPNLKKGDSKRVNFRMFYDDQGNHFTTKNDIAKGGQIIRQLEMVVDGKLYEVPVRLGL